MAPVTSDLSVSWRGRSGKPPDIGLTKVNRTRRSWETKDPLPRVNRQARAQGPAVPHAAEQQLYTSRSLVRGSSRVYPGCSTGRCPGGYCAGTVPLLAVYRPCSCSAVTARPRHPALSSVSRVVPVSLVKRLLFGPSCRSRVGLLLHLGVGMSSRGVSSQDLEEELITRRWVSLPGPEEESITRRWVPLPGPEKS